jgi:hypothetical protein
MLFPRRLARTRPSASAAERGLRPPGWDADSRCGDVVPRLWALDAAKTSVFRTGSPRDWPISLYTRFEEWEAFVRENYRADLTGAALSRAEAVMTEMCIMLPTQQALQEAWMTRR